MGIEILQTSQGSTQRQNLSECKLSDFDLPLLVATMKRSDEWSNQVLHAMILFKGQNEKIVLTAMHEGTEIESFQSNNSVSLRILEGQLKFHIQEDAVIIHKDQLVTLKEHIKYRLTTGEQTIFLMTISDIGNTVVNN
ncbi:MAG: hypothetical protein IPN67_11505 [Bacteroidales bacterium]|nr:hypothetical protein [Bacteroidales bacterium]MBK8882979.1 hypothetical protein [Bacteroidales bacterium]